MDVLLSLPAIYATLSLAALALAWVAAGLLFYGWLADRVVFEAGGRVTSQRLGVLDIGIAGTLVALILASVVPALHGGPSTDVVEPEKFVSTKEMIEGLLLSSVIFLVIVGAILASLTSRNIRWRDVFGFDRISALGVLGWAAFLLTFALPLIYGSQFVSLVVLAANGRVDNSQQDLVRFLQHTNSVAARVIVAVSAVVFAPMQEEFIFRGYLYGTVRRYAGVTVGVLFNSALFALIHLHLPSFGALFMLGVCLTLTYEWTGSLFVPMAMHGLFNALTVINLLHGHAR